MDGEVVTPRPVVQALREFPRAIERIDDPDTVRGEPPRVVGGLLGQDGIARTAFGQRGGDPGLGGGVTGGLELGGSGAERPGIDLVSKIPEDPSGTLGKGCGESDIIGRGRVPRGVVDHERS